MDIFFIIEAVKRVEQIKKGNEEPLTLGKLQRRRLLKTNFLWL